MRAKVSELGTGAIRSIVFVNRYFYPDESATAQVLTDLVRALSARGFDVRVICSRQLYDEPSVQLAPRERIFEAWVRRVATTRFGRYRLLGRALDYASFYVSCAFCLLTTLKRGDLLVVKTDPPLMSLLAAPIAALKQVRLVNWQQDVFPEVASLLGMNPLPRWADAYLRRLRNASLRSSQMNVVIGSHMRDYFAANGIPPSKLCVIENWANGEAIKPKLIGASSLRARLGLGDRFVVCYSGNLGRAHEFDTLLRAAEALKLERTFVFLMVGGGASMVALRRAVEERGLESFCFLPYQPREELNDSLAAADVHLACLLPALEGLIVPSKVYGVLAAGRPLIYIGRPDGEVARVLHDAQCGLAVQVGEAAALTDALRYLQANPEVRAAMGERARRLFCENYSLGKAVDRWVSLLNSG
jgi:colanic acid biosynthesis glycosyl transferase WcaI